MSTTKSKTNTENYKVTYFCFDTDVWGDILDHRITSEKDECEGWQIVIKINAKPRRIGKIIEVTV